MSEEDRDAGAGHAFEQQPRRPFRRARWAAALPLAALALLAFGASGASAQIAASDADRLRRQLQRRHRHPVRHRHEHGWNPDRRRGRTDRDRDHSRRQDRLRIVNQSGGTVTPIDTATNTAGPAITGVGGNLGKIAITPDGKTAYVVNQLGGVTPIDTATNTAGSTISLGGVLNSIAIAPDGKTAYVTVRNSQQVDRINTATNTLRPSCRPRCDSRPTGNWAAARIVCDDWFADRGQRAAIRGPAERLTRPSTCQIVRTGS